MKMEGVPVEFKVATIFCPICALFPIPVMINLPFDEKIAFTASEKSSSKSSIAFLIALLSKFKVLIAEDIMSELFIKTDLYLVFANIKRFMYLYVLQI